jgi:hypothetical protein
MSPVVVASACPARRDPRVLPDRKALLAPPVLSVLSDRPGLLARLDQSDQLDPPGPLDQPAPPDPLDRLDL